MFYTFFIFNIKYFSFVIVIHHSSLKKVYFGVSLVFLAFTGFNFCQKRLTG
jgi:hypothetical protein